MPTPNTSVTTAERQRAQQALELRMSGQTWAAVAAALQYADESGARKAANALLDRTDFELADEYRDTEGARLERLLLAVWPAALAGDLQAVEGARKLIESRVRLYGLAAPSRVEVRAGITAKEFATEAVRLLDELGGDLPPLPGGGEPWVLDDNKEIQP